MAAQYKTNILRYFKPIQLFPLATLILGLVLLVFLPGIPPKLMGGGIIILSLIGLVLMLSETIKSEVIRESRPSATIPPELSYTTKKDNEGKRLVFEDAVKILEMNSEIPHIAESVKAKATRTNYLEMLSSIITRISHKEITKPVSQAALKTKSRLTTNEEKKVGEKEKSKPHKEDLIENFEEVDSGFKILGKVQKTTPPNSDSATIEQSEKAKIIVETQEDQSVRKYSEISDYGATASISQETEVAPVETSNKTELSRVALDKEASEQPQQVLYSKQEINVEITELISDGAKSKGEPIKEMKLLFEKMLGVIRTVTFTQTASFFLINHYKNELVLQAIISERSDALNGVRKIPLGGDLLSRIVKEGKPQIIRNINPNAELDLFPYYSKPLGTKSFVGVPIYYRDSIIGILCADSQKDNAYDEYSMNFFIHFSKIFNFFLENYTEKCELLVDSKVLQKIDEIRKEFYSPTFKFNESIKNISHSLISLFDFTTAGVCIFDNEAKFYRIFDIKSRKNIDIELKSKRVELDKTIVGKSIKSTKTALNELDETKIRLHYSESRIRKGFLVSVPIKGKNGVYGAIFAYVDEPIPIPKHYINAIEDYAFSLALIYETYFLQEQIMQTRRQETHSGLIDTEYFIQRVSEEVERSRAFGNVFSLCQITIDHYIYDTSIAFKLSKEAFGLVLSTLKPMLNTFDVIGRLDENSFGVIFVGRNGKDSKIIMETVRQKIAQSPITIGKDIYFATISVGISQFYSDSTASKLLQNCKEALDISLKRGNAVTLF